MAPKTNSTTREQLQLENQALRARVAELEQTLQALQTGAVDAITIPNAQGDQIFTLQGAEQVYRILIEEMSDGALTMALDGTILYCNRRFAGMLDVPLNRVIGSRLVDWLAPAERGKFGTLLQQAGRQNQRTEISLPRKNGGALPAAVIADFLSLGELQLIYLVVVDLSEYKSKETALQAMLEEARQAQAQRQTALEALDLERSLLRQLIDNLPDLIFLKDRQSRFLVANQAIASFMGAAAPDELVGRTDLDYYPEPLARQYRAAEQQVMQSGESILGFERPQLDVHQNEHWLAATKLPLRDAQGQIIGLVGIEREITARKRAEEDVIKRNTDLLIVNAVNEAANRGESIQDITAAFVESAHAAFHCRSAAIYLLSPDRQFIELKSTTFSKQAQAAVEKLLGQPVPAVRLPFEKDGYFDKLLANPDGLLLADPQEIQAWMTQFTETTFLSADLRAPVKSLIPQIYDLIGIRSTILLPLLASDQVIGMFDLNSDALLTGEHLERMRRIASQITAAILRRQAEQALRESEEKYRGLLESLDSVVAQVDVDGKFLFLNELAAQSLGAKPEDLIGKTMHQLFPAAVADRQLEHIRKAIHADQVATYELPSALNGKPRWYRTTIQPIHDPTGKVAYALVNSTDIHELKTAQQQLQELNRSLEERVRERTAELTRANAALLASQAILQSFYDSAPFMMGIADLDGDSMIAVSGNRAMATFLAQQPENLPGYTSSQLGTPDGMNRLWVEAYRRSQERGETVKFEYEFPHTSGQRWLEATATFIGPGTAGLPRFSFVVEDVTERKRSEEKLRLSEEKYASLFHKSAVPALLTRLADRTYADVNEVFTEQYGYSREEMLGRTSLQVGFLRPDERTRMLGVFHGQGFHQANEVRVFTKSGEERVALVNSRAVEFDGQAYAITTAYDITEQKKAEEKIRFQSSILDVVGQAVIVTDLEGRISYWNQAAEKIYGWTAAETLGRLVTEVTVPRVSEQQAHEIMQALAAGQEWQGDFLAQRKDGSVFWIHIVDSPVLDENGNLVSLIGVSMDITDRKQAEAALRQNEERMEYAFTGTQDGIWDWNLETDEVFYSSRYKLMLGYEEDEVEPHVSSWKRLLHPDDLPRAVQVQAEVLSGNREYVMEFRMRHKDGHYMDILSRGFPIRREANGPIVRIVGTHLDLTERKRAEAALREREEQNRLLFDESPVSAILLNPEGVIVRANRACQELTGLALEQLSGRPARELGLFTPEDYDRLRALVAQARSSGEPSVSTEFWMRSANGSQIEVASRISPFTYDGSEHILATMIDISIYKLAEDLLRQANIEMEQAMRMKDDFLANMSHELRTPLTGILGMSEAMLLEIGGPLTERQKKYLVNIEASGRHLLSLINDILDLSKIEAGKVELELENVHAEDICQSSLVFIKEPALKRQVNVTYHCEPASIPLMADARRLKQILVNLLSNAVKFTPAHGRVTLNVQADPQQAAVCFEVVDTGIGMSADDLARLFTPFTQVDSSLSRRHEGTGLGLALVKKLTELHGGTVRVESEPGKGSRFSVTIPWRQGLETNVAPAISAPPVSQVVPADPEKTRRKRILIAEDNEVNAIVTRDFLEIGGYEVAWAADGAVVLAMALQFRPDLVLMDIQMPAVDGLEAIRRFRQIPEFQAMPIIALTALAMRGDRERCLAAGANEYITKPFSYQAMAQMIETLLEKDGRTGALH